MKVGDIVINIYTGNEFKIESKYGKSIVELSYVTPGISGNIHHSYSYFIMSYQLKPPVASRYKII